MASKWPFWERKDLGCCGVSMVGPQLGRETDAIAESAYKIKRRLCVTTLHVILKSGRLEKWSGQSRTSRTGGAAPVLAKL